MAWERVVVQPSGAIVENANSYISESDFDAYCATIGQSLTSYDDDAQQTAVIAAGQYINTRRYAEEPDEGKYSVMKFPQGGVVPPVVKQAQLMLSVKILTTPDIKLYNDTTGNGKIKQEVTGVISTTYFSPEESGEQSDIRFDFVDDLLGDLIVDSAGAAIWIGQGI